MPNQRITYGENTWEIEYEVRIQTGKSALQVKKICGSISTLELWDQFLKALRPLWNSLKLPDDTALAIEEELIRHLADPPTSNRTQ